MRGLQHGLLQGQARQHFSRVGLSDRRLRRSVDQIRALNGIPLHIHHVATCADGTARQIDLVLRIAQIGDRRSDDALQIARRPRITCSRHFKCLTQLANGIEHVLSLVGIDRDIELVTCRRNGRRATERKADAGRRCNACRYSSAGDRSAATGQRTSV
ncbi:hypothetical protein D3C87_1273150 [compost metagenome]